ncbi:hypothetical protein SDC9_90493 [bioreactor metagenome]|uniref:Uncharacterized protein n=1 Tax=bioreactor metagenome TaxID=1076179 RepID=A0A644ZST8_9ZZZZ
MSHPRFELHLHLAEAALQQADGLGNGLAVLFRFRFRTAPALAPAHVVVEAGALFADIPRKLFIAGGKLQGHPQGVDNPPGGPTAAVRAEIPGAVFGHPGRQRERGIGVLHGEFDIGIGLVVLEEDVVARLVPLDERAFQH